MTDTVSERVRLETRRKRFVESIILAVRRAGIVSVAHCGEMDWHPTPMQEGIRILTASLAAPRTQVTDPPPETVHYELDQECQRRGWEMIDIEFGGICIIAPFKRRQCLICDGQGRFMKSAHILDRWDPSQMITCHTCPKCHGRGYREDRIEDPPWTDQDHEVLRDFMMSKKPWEIQYRATDDEMLRKAWRWKLEK